MANYRTISSDSHVYEPRDLWTSRVPAKYKDRAMCVVRREDGSDWWYCDGKLVNYMGIAAQTGMRFDEPEKLKMDFQFEDIRLGGYIPEEHIKDQDQDGVDVSIVYPTATLPLFKLVDSELLSVMFSTYNDWLAEFCAPYPDRLKGIAMLNVDDIQEGVKNLERAAKAGLAGAMIAVYPLEDKQYNSPEYDPLWAAAQDLEMPLSLHIGSNRGAYGQKSATVLDQTEAGNCNNDHWVRMSLGYMIFSGVFERYPKLQVGSIEHELGWIPYFVGKMDYVYSQKAPRPGWRKFGEDMLPSDYFRRNVFVGFQEDALGIQLREKIGVDNLTWGSDYPHIESTFPRSQQILEEILVGCTEEEKAKIVGGNAARVYHLD